MEGTQATSILAISDHQQSPIRFFFLDIMVASHSHHTPNEIHHLSRPYIFPTETTLLIYLLPCTDSVIPPQNFKFSLTFVFLIPCLGGVKCTQLIIFMQGY